MYRIGGGSTFLLFFFDFLLRTDNLLRHENHMIELPTLPSSLPIIYYLNRIPTIYRSLASIHIYILFKIKQLQIHIYIYIWPSRIHNIYRSRRHSKIQTSVEKFARSICDLFDHPSSIISICRHNPCCPIKPAILYTSYHVFLR